MCGAAGVQRRHVYELSFAGNTTMQHLLCALDPTQLGQELSFPCVVLPQRGRLDPGHGHEPLVDGRVDLVGRQAFLVGEATGLMGLICRRTPSVPWPLVITGLSLACLLGSISFKIRDRSRKLQALEQTLFPTHLLHCYNHRSCQ
jgi:hypothetical protein